MTPNPIQPDSPSHKLCNELTTSTTITSDLTTTGTSIVNKQQQQQHQNNLQGEGLPSVEQQLKYENERLKLALAQRFDIFIYIFNKIILFTFYIKTEVKRLNYL